MTERRVVREPTAPPEELTRALRELAGAPGRSLSERVFDRFLRANGPLGPCFVVSSSIGVRHVALAANFDDEPDNFAATYRQRFGRPLRSDDSPPTRIERALSDGAPQSVAVDLSMLTPFEQAVLTTTRTIPRGEVRPYGWVAREIGAPAAVRAVGSALARNPIPFVVPCHRVVRSDGTTGNYGFGPASKVAILSDEGIELVGPSTLGPSGMRLVASATTKIVCYPTCRSARRITDRHRVGFASLVAAKEAGYRPCDHCRPL